MFTYLKECKKMHHARCVERGIISIALQPDEVLQVRILLDLFESLLIHQSQLLIYNEHPQRQLNFYGGAPRFDWNFLEDNLF